MHFKSYELIRFYMLVLKAVEAQKNQGLLAGGYWNQDAQNPMFCAIGAYIGVDLCLDVVTNISEKENQYVAFANRKVFARALVRDNFSADLHYDLQQSKNFIQLVNRDGSHCSTNFDRHEKMINLLNQEIAKIVSRD